VRDVEERREGEKHKERAEGGDELWSLAALSSVIYRAGSLGWSYLPLVISLVNCWFSEV
jgi:hypothetical protein